MKDEQPSTDKDNFFKLLLRAARPLQPEEQKAGLVSDDSSSAKQTHQRSPEDTDGQQRDTFHSPSASTDPKNPQ